MDTQDWDFQKFLDEVAPVAELLMKSLKKEITAEEQILLDEWLDHSEVNSQLYSELSDNAMLLEELKRYMEVNERREIVRQKLFKEIELEAAEGSSAIKISTRRRKYKWLIAASILLFLSIGSYVTFFTGTSKVSDGIVSVTTDSSDVAPGSYKALLRLENGAIIKLDNSQTGELAKQGNTSVTNSAGQLIYLSSGQNAPGEIMHNILSTGPGETYPTILSDGSKIWLNNLTTMRYPVSFVGKERKIELQGGEAYFEVAHNSRQPFKVLVNGIEIEVLGTRFSIQSYKDENDTKASLLQGKVKVSNSDGKNLVLKPGQAAKIIAGTNNLELQENADVDGSISWVQGAFYFDDSKVENVLRQLARWYNVEIEYRGKTSNEKFRGKIERNIPLSEVLQNLNLMGQTSFKIENRKIIVNP